MSFLNANTAKIFGALSGVVQGVGQLVNAREEVEVGTFNANILNQRAQAERSSQDLLEIQKRKVLKKQVGTQIALVGKSGIQFSGSPIDVITDSISNAELDISIDRFNSEVTARGFETEAELKKFEARQRSRVSTARASTSFLSTAADLAGAIPKKKKVTKLGDSPFGTALTPTGPISFIRKPNFR